MRNLREFTSARVALGRAGNSLPTSELLEFQMAHAQARDAVHARLDVGALMIEVRGLGLEAVAVRSAAADRQTYLQRPDLGRVLSPESRDDLRKAAVSELVIVIADGLSALAVQRHSVAFLRELAPVHALVVIAEQGRVAIGDEIAAVLGASMVAVLIGERPGLSSPDSLGVYLTWKPAPGKTTDAGRNCISNIRPGGLGFEAAAAKLTFLMIEARRLKLTGVQLKERNGDPLPTST